jgi:hypothetical protein
MDLATKLIKKRAICTSENGKMERNKEKVKKSFKMEILFIKVIFKTMLRKV